MSSRGVRDPRREMADYADWEGFSLVIIVWLDRLRNSYSYVLPHYQRKASAASEKIITLTVHILSISRYAAIIPSHFSLIQVIGIGQGKFFQFTNFNTMLNPQSKNWPATQTCNIKLLKCITCYCRYHSRSQKKYNKQPPM